MNKERKLIIAGNWKMNKTVAEALTLVSDLKRDLAELVIDSLSPIAERFRELRSDPVRLNAIALQGAQKAAQVAGPRYRSAAASMGLLNG